MSRRHSRRHSAPGGAGHGRAALAGLGLLTALAVGVAGIALGGSFPRASAAPAESAARFLDPPDSTTTTVSSGDRSLTVAVSPHQGLPPSGAQVTVAGSGFDPSHDLWIAVCQDDGVAPAALLHCIGGAIPDDNATAGWGVVTDSHDPPFPGPVTTSWHGHGSFKLTLHLPAAISDAADCVSAPCSVYTRSSDDADRSEDVGVPLVFTAPPGMSSSGETSSASSSTSSGEATSSSSAQSSSQQSSSEPSTTAEPSTETYGSVPTTVTPDSMLRTSVAVGATQTVVFTGFTAGEKVDVTVYSDPLKLRTVKADHGGHVRISFTVPRKLPPGEHILQAIGRKSGRIGIARFAVGAATSSSPASTTASASATGTGQASSVTESAAASAGAGAASSPSPSTSDLASTGSGPASSAIGTSTAASTLASSSSGAVTPTSGGGNRLLWLWIVLAVLVVVGGAAGAVALVRHRRQEEDDLPVTGATVTPPPGWAAASDAAPPTAPGNPTLAMPTAADEPGGGFGLLSGREHPDGPVLYSGGQWPDRPTSVLGDQDAPPSDPTARQAGPTPAPGGPGEPPADPSTQQWRPDFTGPSPAAPSTQQWRPEFTGPSPAVPPGPPEPPAEPGSAPQAPASPDDPDPSGTSDDPPTSGRHRSD